GSSTATVLRGNGDGSLGARTECHTGSDPRSVAIADLNGDGRPDLALASSGSNAVSMLIVDADGNIASRSEYMTAAYPNSVAIGELNDDRTPDLSVAKYVMPWTSVLDG